MKPLQKSTLSQLCEELAAHPWNAAELEELVDPKLGTVEVCLEGVEEAVGDAVTRFTAFFNMTGHPAITLPVGLHSSGLPMGVQVVARPFAEDTLFAAAGHIERHDAFGIPTPRIA